MQVREDNSREIASTLPVNQKGTKKLHFRNQEQAYINQLRQYCEHIVYLLIEEVRIHFISLFLKAYNIWCDNAV